MTAPRSLKLVLLPWLLVAVAGLGGCASTGGGPEGQHPGDPLEPVNRRVMAFNDVVDTWLLKPVARAWKRFTPAFVDRGVSNVFTNLNTPVVALNQLLQGKPKAAGQDTLRFVMNSTVGVAGLFDPAAGAGLPAHEEDLGQTLGVWGLGPGPYLVLPLLGPSTVRDGVGFIGEIPASAVQYLDHVPTRNTVRAVQLVDTRADLLASEALLSGDRYAFIRDAYLQRRDYLVNDGAVDDPFLDDF